MVRRQMIWKVFLYIRKIVEKDLGYFLLALVRSFCFFNQTDFGQYFFKDLQYFKVILRTVALETLFQGM